MRVQAGIPLDRALAFLAEKSGRPLPDSVQAAVASWQQSGIQVRMRTLTVLQVRDPAVLDRLRAAPQVRRFLGETLGPNGGGGSYRRLGASWSPRLPNWGCSPKFIASTRPPILVSPVEWMYNIYNYSDINSRITALSDLDRRTHGD